MFSLLEVKKLKNVVSDLNFVYDIKNHKGIKNCLVI